MESKRSFLKKEAPASPVTISFLPDNKPPSQIPPDSLYPWPHVVNVKSHPVKLIFVIRAPPGHSFVYPGDLFIPSLKTALLYCTEDMVLNFTCSVSRYVPKTVRCTSTSTSLSL